MKEVLVFVLGLFFGTATSILAKTLYLLDVNGKLYTKPMFHTFLMFFGMSVGIPLFFLLSRFKQKPSLDDYEKLEADESNERPKVEVSSFPISKRLFFLFAIPSGFDLVGTALAKQGLIYIDVSIYQLLRCALIISVAGVRYFYLKAIYSSIKKYGIAINSIAVILVASTSFFGDSGEGDSSTVEKLFGILLVLLSCFVQSIQYVFEETVMESEEDGVHPLLVVGFEGFWGMLMTAVIVLPISYYVPGNDCRLVDGVERCCYEDTFDSLHMMYTSSTVFWLSLFYVFVISSYNIFAVYVTYLLDSVWHAILDNFRPISVWLTQLVLYQLLNGSFGERWTNGSFIQLAGLFVMLYGTAVYNGNIWPEEEEEDVEPLSKRQSAITRLSILSA